VVDVKSILDEILGGAGRRQGQASPAGRGGIEDILGQLGRGRGGSGGGLDELVRNILGGERGQTQPGAEQPAPSGPSGSSFDDLARNLSPGDIPPGRSSPSGSGRSATPEPQSSGGDLGDILGDLQRQILGKDSEGSLLDTLGKVLREAASGTREGAERIGDATGAREAIEKMSGGRSPEELMKQLQELIEKNKLGTGVALGGLGALILGTETGRSIATSAAKIGALALIGGLAYKAYQHHAEGQPPGAEGDVRPEPAPKGSGFEESAVSDQAARTYLRAMIAAAAADGRLDADEQRRLTTTLAEAGMDREAEAFIAEEINNPASIDELVAGVSDQREALQLYTAARLAIEPNTPAEQAFLATLASRLGIDADLARHVDTTTQSLAS
jgi:uncharacterized membrane protein YebE (DUF533 family)